jgi:putative ABC transport system permease protein
MHILMLALRNLQRNRRGSITTLLAIVVGVRAILLFGGFSRDITLGMQTDIVQHTGHLQVQRHGFYTYGSGNSSAFGIQDYERVIDVLRADPVLRPVVRVITPSLQLGGVAGNFDAGVTRTVFAEGMVAEDQQRMLTWNDYAFPGQSTTFALAGTAEDAAVIGEGLARVLQLCAPLKVQNCETPSADPTNPASHASATPEANANATVNATANAASDAPADVMALLAAEATAKPAVSLAPHIELLAATAHGAPNVGRFTVVKAEQQGVKEFDDVYVAMHLPRAQRLVYGADAPAVTAIAIQLQHTDQLPFAQQRIRQLLAEHFPAQSLDVLDFATLNPFYGQTNGMFAVIFGFVFVLICVIVLFVVGNTMSTAVVERTVEIGTLRAMGTRRGGIQLLFICEGLLLGLTGAAAGVAVALLLAFAVNHSGIAWTPPARVDSIALTVRVWGAWSQIALTFASLAVLASLSAWLPARNAARMSIVDALRHV